MSRISKNRKEVLSNVDLTKTYSIQKLSLMNPLIWP